MKSFVQLLCVLVYFAATERTVAVEPKSEDSGPLNVSVSLNRVAAGDADSMEVIVTIDVTNGWYVYAESYRGPFKPLRICFDVPDGVHLCGEAIRVTEKAIQVGDVNKTYSGRVCFRQKIKINKNDFADTSIKVFITYQACTLEMCFPPDTVEVAKVIPGSM